MVGMCFSEEFVLWRKQGEDWAAIGRLPDFSFAGYRFGEAVPPTPPVGRQSRTLALSVTAKR